MKQITIEEIIQLFDKGLITEIEAREFIRRIEPKASFLSFDKDKL